MNKHKKISLFILITTAIALYFLAGISINPFIFWTSLPLYISYFLINAALKSNTIKALYAAYGFMTASIIFSLFYHFTWHLDWQGTKTGSSTSALIFIWLPLYSVILGSIGYALGRFAGILSEHSKS